MRAFVPLLLACLTATALAAGCSPPPSTAPVTRAPGPPQPVASLAPPLPHAGR